MKIAVTTKRTVYHIVEFWGKFSICCASIPVALRCFNMQENTFEEVRKKGLLSD